MVGSEHEMSHEEELDLEQWLETIVPKKETQEFFFLDNYLGDHLVKTHNIQIDSAEPLVATLFWQIFLSSIFPDLLRQNSRSAYNANAPEVIIIPVNESRFVPVIFAREINKIQVIYTTNIPRSLDPLFWTEAIYIWRQRALSNLVVSERLYGKKVLERYKEYISTVERMAPEFMFQNIGRMNEVIVLAPGLDAMDMVSTCPPSGHCVSLEQGGSCIATVGIFAENHHGFQGATIPFHAIRHLLPANPYNTTPPNIYVEGERYFIYSQDVITDSCFIVPTDGKPVNNYDPTRGPLSGMVPRSQEDVFFDGYISGKKNAFITGWTPDLPIVTPDCQLRVFTNPVTNPGDSGAALRNIDGFVLGFAFQRSGLKQKMQTSSWIWADSVFQAHNLVL